MTVTPLVVTWAALVGACVGSFVNVVCYRLPIIRGYGPYQDGVLLGELKAAYGKYTLAAPASACTCCKSKIPAWLNIPVLGWILARGKCIKCKSPITIRYPSIELLFATVFGLNVYIEGVYPASLMTLPAMPFLFLFVWFRAWYGVRLWGFFGAFLLCLGIQAVLASLGFSQYS